MLEIINNVLNYSKIQAGRLSIANEGFDLDRLVASALLAVKPMAEKNHNTITVTKSKYPGLIYSDELKLRQILINLLSNAAKFTQEGSIDVQITIQPFAQFDDGRQSACLIMQISDTGIGIPESAWHKLFKPFSQVDESYNRQSEGTGLGLVLTKSFTELLDGSISLKSEYGAGTQFVVKIPVELEEVLIERMPTPAVI